MFNNYTLRQKIDRYYTYNDSYKRLNLKKPGRNHKKNKQVYTVENKINTIQSIAGRSTAHSPTVFGFFNTYYSIKTLI